MDVYKNITVVLDPEAFPLPVLNRDKFFFYRQLAIMNNSDQ
jgi:hypothetical protein